ncbi:MAG: DUF1810 domain-containing protein [Gemmatimonadetes bacterium]|nr:DUF1810 domain-containing protein [Gemmatimonadota bacterium]
MAYDLDRFLPAQEESYDRALDEIAQGAKLSHWMWYIFPQIAGLGSSSLSKLYAIANESEARVYLAHLILGPRLIECVEALLRIDDRSARQIFGSPDDLKMRSCATLFEVVSPEGSVFTRLLEKYFKGERDPKTTEILAMGVGYAE